MSSVRVTNLLRLVRQMDPEFDKLKRTEPEYQFGDRIFTGTTANRGAYESPLTGFLNGSYSGVTLPGS